MDNLSKATFIFFNQAHILKLILGRELNRPITTTRGFAHGQTMWFALHYINVLHYININYILKEWHKTENIQNIN